jgi:hypothetical protein
MSWIASSAIPQEIRVIIACFAKRGKSPPDEG